MFWFQKKKLIKYGENYLNFLEKVTKKDILYKTVDVDEGTFVARVYLEFHIEGIHKIDFVEIRYLKAGEGISINGLLENIYENKSERRQQLIWLEDIYSTHWR